MTLILSRSPILSILFLIVYLFPFSLFSGGIMLYEISSADARLASAGWSSRAQDPSTVFTNPAGMTRLRCPQAEFGVQPLYAHIVFDQNCQTSIPGGKGYANAWFPSGSLFYVHPINDCFSVGIGSLAYFGADLRYSKNWTGRYFLKEAYLQSFSLIPAAAYRINDCLSIGVGANVMYGIFRQKSYINNKLDKLSDGRIQVHDLDLSFGAVVGVLYELSSCTRFGIQYLTPVKFKFHDTPHFQNIGPVLKDLLTKTGLLDSSVKVNVRVPQSLLFSAYHDVNDCWTVMGDCGWQQWSKYQKVSINLASPSSVTLTSKNKYQDTWHVAAGIEYHYSPCWTFSGGMAYDSSAVSKSQRKLDFPVGEQWRIGTGARWYYSANLIVDMCYELEWTGDLPINVQGGDLLGRVGGKFKNVYLEFINFNLTWIF